MRWRGSGRSCPGSGSARTTGSAPTTAPASLADLFRGRSQLLVYHFIDGVVYHTYSTYERGLDALWSMYQWLVRAPLGRNEAGMWWRRHDEYGGQ
jgi:predicted dithiol-disulfide oxidoreductase (DUF899 family)